MTLEQYAYAAQIITALAVVASLIYLAIQMRQNNSLLAAQASYAQFSVERERRARMLENRAGLLDISLKANSGEELTRTETNQLAAHWRDVLDSWQWQFRESQVGRLQSGIIDFDSWRSLWEFDAGLQGVYSDTVNRRDADFVQFMEQNVIDH